MVLAIRSTPSDTAVSDLPGVRAMAGAPADTLESPASANSDLERRQLADWMVEGGLPPYSEPRRVVTKGDLDAALGSAPRRAGLFTAGSDAQRSRWLSRLPYGSIMAKAAERNRVDPLLLAAVVEAESRFAPRARSHGGALGLMQLLPQTARENGTRNPLDPYANVEAGSRYLGRLLLRFQGRCELALAAYNTGPEVIARCGCVPPYRETQAFVKRVMALYEKHQQGVLQQSLDPRSSLLASARTGRSGLLGLRSQAREVAAPAAAPASAVALGR